MTMMLDKVRKLEAERRAAGVPQQRVLRLADMGHNTVARWLAGLRTARPGAVARYHRALRVAELELSAADRPVLNLWDALLVLVAREHGVCPAATRAFDAGLRATRSAQWVAQQRVRWEVIYLMNMVFGVRQHEIAKVLGVTRQAVQRAVRAVEAARDGDLDMDIDLDAALDARLTKLTHDLTETG
jgi:transcriptional regulator with XRE-family HTH domain